MHMVIGTTLRSHALCTIIRWVPRNRGMLLYSISQAQSITAVQ